MTILESNFKSYTKKGWGEITDPRVGKIFEVIEILNTIKLTKNEKDAEFELTKALKALPRAADDLLYVERNK